MSPGEPLVTPRPRTPPGFWKAEISLSVMGPLVCHPEDLGQVSPGWLRPPPSPGWVQKPLGGLR